MQQLCGLAGVHPSHSCSLIEIDGVEGVRGDGPVFQMSLNIIIMEEIMEEIMEGASSPSFSDSEKIMHSVLRTMHEPRVSQLHADEVSSLLVEECAKLKSKLTSRLTSKLKSKLTSKLETSFNEEDFCTSDLHVIETGVICTTGDLSRIRLQKLTDRFRAERLMRVRLMHMLLDTCHSQLKLINKSKPVMVDASTLTLTSTPCAETKEDHRPVLKQMRRCLQRGRTALSRIFSNCKQASS